MAILPSDKSGPWLLRVNYTLYGPYENNTIKNMILDRTLPFNSEFCYSEEDWFFISDIEKIKEHFPDFASERDREHTKTLVITSSFGIKRLSKDVLLGFLVGIILAILLLLFKIILVYPD